MEQDHGKLANPAQLGIADAIPLLFPEREVAQRLNIHRNTLARFRLAGEIAYVRMGRVVLYAAEHVSAFLKSKEVTPCRVFDAPGSGSTEFRDRPIGISVGTTPFLNEQDVKALAQRIKTSPAKR